MARWPGAHWRQDTDAPGPGGGGPVTAAAREGPGSTLRASDWLRLANLTARDSLMGSRRGLPAAFPYEETGSIPL